MDHQAAWPTVDAMLAMSNDELAKVDPVVMNLEVARGVPSLAHLKVEHYVELADTWAAAIKQELPAGDARFDLNPKNWQGDLDFARLALMCWYISDILKIRYREDQKRAQRILYTDPCDLFLNGVMDSGQGTCGNMALLHIALGWRLGWPVSLACAGSHFICRFDDGSKRFNIEATNPGEDGSFCAPPDSYYRHTYRISQLAVDCGSDLRAVTPRELFGLFIGARARHYENTNRFTQAEQDYLLARFLFPANRALYVSLNMVTVQKSVERFELGELGHPVELAEWLQEFCWHSARKVKSKSIVVPVAFQQFVREC